MSVYLHFSRDVDHSFHQILRMLPPAHGLRSCRRISEQSKLVGSCYYYFTWKNFKFLFVTMSFFFNCKITPNLPIPVNKWSCSVVSDSLWSNGLYPTRLLHPWNFPGKSTGVDCHFLLQEIFPTQGSNPGLPHCRQLLYHLNHQGGPYIYLPISVTPSGHPRADFKTRELQSRWLGNTHRLLLPHPCSHVQGVRSGIYLSEFTSDSPESIS